MPSDSKFVMPVFARLYLIPACRVLVNFINKLFCNLTSPALKLGTSPKGCARGRSRSGNKKSVPGWWRPWKRGGVWHIRSFHGSSVCSGIQTVAAWAKLDTGESPSTYCEVASVPRVQLGCDQCHYQEAGGSAPALTLLLCKLVLYIILFLFLMNMPTQLWYNRTKSTSKSRHSRLGNANVKKWLDE